MVFLLCSVDTQCNVVDDVDLTNMYSCALSISLLYNINNLNRK